MRPLPADHQGKRGTFEIHGGPCGSVKTWKCVAPKIRSEGDNYRRIYVAAPTHIVCSEVFEALKDVPGMPLISLEIKDSKSPKRNSMAKVKIIPHDVLLRHLEEN